jgi:hypothetical protein
MPGYDAAQFAPPAPVAGVTLSNPNTGVTWRDVPMLLDSGADISLVPQSAVIRLGVTIIPDRRYELMAFDGSVSHTSIVFLELIFCRRTFRGQFLLIDQSWGILGRNVLNAVPLLLDGPRLTWDEHPGVTRTP